ncbi:MAG: glycoside hydrolase family 44 protein [Chloroflexi bacterium]|nr:glycoside hydrolase family 44 protein [Chloroflexota bacterium]OJV94019.1 MAG: hypothetical protein BGO39_06785 [Chloroflexi bacterium 54-19]
MSFRHLSLGLVVVLSLTLLLGVPWDAALTLAAPTTAGNQPAVVGPTLTVNVLGQRHSISPDIYGMNGYGTNLTDFASLMQNIHMPVERWGGNSTSRYNWQTNSFNSGSDWYFEGNPNTGNNPANGQPSESDEMINRDRTYGASSIITIPIIGYVSKSRTDHLCGFSVTKYGPQQDTDPWDSDCGNGVKSNGTLITTNNPLDTSVAVSPDFMKAWINDMIGKYGTAAQGGVKIYQLDNEPSDWYETHRDVHPAELTYDELRDRTYQYAAAIKQADPTAQTLGPSNFGWYVYADSQVPGDRAAHSDVGFSEWYLQQMKLYEQQHGVRILDYFDQHYYPAQVNPQNGQYVTLSPAGDANTQALRLRSTRSLWDPTYYDESWIQDAGFGPIEILPLFHQWIDANYPGTRIAITEYNWGGLESINGALAQADVLGIFGRERVDLATLWDPPTSTQPGAYAFRIYRNYDGQGSMYGDTWVQASSTDQGQLAVYAAQRTSDQAVTLVIINKTGNSLTSTLNLSNFQPATTAKVFRYSSANLNAIVAQPDQSVTASGFQATYPANSITMVVLTNAPGDTYTVTSTSDDGTGNTLTTFSNALKQAKPNDTVLLNVSSVRLDGPLQSPLPKGITISGGICSATPVTIDFNGQPGFTLSGNMTLKNLNLTGMSRAGPGLTNATDGTHNTFICTKIQVAPA